MLNLTRNIQYLFKELIEGNNLAELFNYCPRSRDRTSEVIYIFNWISKYKLSWQIETSTSLMGRSRLWEEGISKIFVSVKFIVNTCVFYLISIL